MKTAEAVQLTEVAAVSPAKVKVLVVGQTPPPFHGQSLMIKMLLDGDLPGVELHHVRMAFSEDMNQVGRFQLGKLVHLLVVICKIIYGRFRFGTRILYYPPAGPNLVPVLRDIAILLSTRWLFTDTVFHFQACGVGEYISRLPYPLRWLARRAMSQPSLAVQLSELTASDANHLSARTVCTIPNAAHDEAERMQFERLPRDESKPMRVLYLGTVCEGKGILVLLQAVADAIRAGKQLQLDVVGSFQPAEFRAEVEALIDTQELQSHVHLWGQLTGSDKWQRFAEADVFCFPSHYHSEAFPCVLVEAMCFSLPVISTRWRGIPSIVKPGETGYLIDPHDHQALAKHLQALADQPDLCLQLGMAGRNRYCECFTVEHYLSGLRRAFLELGQP